MRIFPGFEARWFLAKNYIAPDHSHVLNGVLPITTADRSRHAAVMSTLNLLGVGTRVRIRISCRGSLFTALGGIANVRPEGSIGVIFTRVVQNDQLTLDKWVNEL